VNKRHFNIILILR